MWKRLLRFSFFSLLLIIVSCAPRVAPPPLYSGLELSVDEVLSRSGGNIETLKAVLDARIYKDDMYYSSMTASVLIKKPGLVRMRIYKFGVPVNDILIRRDGVHLLSGKTSPWLIEVGTEFYHAVFWWDGIREASMSRKGTDLVITGKNKEMILDSATLIPKSQFIRKEGRSAEIAYRKPVQHGDQWIPSDITIRINGTLLLVQVEKTWINPQTGDTEFLLPGEGRLLNEPFIPHQGRG